MRVVWTAGAAEDLFEIVALTRSVRSADRLRRQILDVVRRISQVPGLGREAGSADLREIPVVNTPYRIGYVRRGSVLVVLGVVDSRREYPAGSGWKP